MAAKVEKKGDLAMALAHARALLERSPALAEEQTREILRIVPLQPEALTLRGLALAAQGRTQEAVDVLHVATAHDPDFAEAWRVLGDQLVLAGDGPGADAAYAQQIRCSVNVPELQRAAIALCKNELAIAEHILKPYLKRYPTDVAAIRMLAELAGRLQRYIDAENLLNRAIELAPSFAPARFNLATVFYRTGRTPRAIEELERLLADDPQNIASRNLLAAALGRIGDVAEAVRHYEHVLALLPDASRIWLSYGHSLKTVGRQADSVAAYRRCIALEPGFGEAWWSLANLKTVKLSAADITEMKRALGDGRLNVEDRYHLHFALGKAHEDAGDAEAAFHHYDEGNRLRRTELDYDPAVTTGIVDRSTAVFTPAFLASRAGRGNPAPDPIFILGMPRAGSTLIEQILSSHPLIEGTQELPQIQRLAKQLGAEERPGRYPLQLTEGEGAKLREWGEEFIETTHIHRKTGRPFFIDKMPNNWAHIGLIHLILPNAKIIDARRHPLGCCFSNFKQHFAQGQAFSYSLETMGRYYNDYVRMMAHIDAVMPGRVHRVFYEAMIEDTETEIRRLLDYVGVPFDPACLKFHENDRAVRTASSEQVRRPIYRDGIEQWRAFEPWLGSLKEVLGSTLTEYPFA